LGEELARERSEREKCAAEAGREREEGVFSWGRSRHGSKRSERKEGACEARAFGGSDPPPGPQSSLAHVLGHTCPLTPPAPSLRSFARALTS
jgi:hypothetical protein